jgi:hypothetical protein
MPERTAGILGGVLVGVTLVVLWLLTGVQADEIASFAAYEIFIVGLPGVLLYRAMSRRPGGALRHVAIGWPVGYAIEVGAFVLTAALDVRELFPFVPLAIAGAAALGSSLARRRVAANAAEPDEGSPALPPAAVIVTAAIAALAVAYLALGYFTQTPLPGDTASVSYPQDNVFDIGVIAEAKTRWPLQHPSVAGVPLRYHIYGFVDIAGVSQVTGIEPATLLFRLVPAVLIVLITIQVVALGRELGRSPWLGPLAAALVLLVGELDLDPERAFPFAGGFFSDLSGSPTFLFGIPLFLAAITIILAALTGRQRLGVRGSLLLMVLLLGAGGAKASILPVCLGALGLWTAWAWIAERAFPRRALAPLALTGAAWALTYLLVYSRGGGAGFSFGLAGFTEFTVIQELAGTMGHSLHHYVIKGAAALVGIIAILLPTLGIIWLIAERRARLAVGETWLLALFVTSLAAFLLLAHPGLGQAYFLYYGYIAGCVLSAQGILLFWQRAGAKDRRGSVLAGLIAGGLAIGLVASFGLHVPGRSSAGLGRLALWYGIVALAVAALAYWGGRRFSGARYTGLGVALVLLISLGALDTPLDEGPPVLRRLADDRPLYVSDGPETRGLTRDLYSGLRWVRDHSGDDEVFAVNNHSLDSAGLNSRYFYYTAFAERRSFLESWLYTPQSFELGFKRVELGERTPFARRLRLSDAAFDRAPPRVLEKLRTKYGVSLLLVDKVHGTATPALAKRARLVFQNDALDVYRLQPA